MSSSNPVNSSNPVKGEVWLLLDSLTFGGIETHVLELASGLLNHEQSVRVILLAKYEQESAIISKLQDRNIPFNYLQELSSQPNRSSLKQIIQTWQPTVVHAHGYKASITSKLACIGTSCQQLSTYHAGETPVGKVKLYDLADRYSAWLSKHTIAVSPAIQNKIPTPSVVMDNFLTLSTSKNQRDHFNNKERLRLGFVGRLSHEKAPDRFIELANLLTECDFIVFGDGDMRNTLEHDAPSNVTFHGFVSDMQSVWPQIDILLITSRYEGLPMTAIEAMANHTFVISTNVGAIQSLIKTGENGWVVESMEEMQTLISDFNALDSEVKASLLNQGYQTVINRFSDKAVIPKVLELYQN